MDLSILINGLSSSAMDVYDYLGILVKPFSMTRLHIIHFDTENISARFLNLKSMDLKYINISIDILILGRRDLSLHTKSFLVLNIATRISYHVTKFTFISCHKL